MALNITDIHIREIAPGDNQALASIIKNTLAEFGAARPGTVAFDESTNTLFEVFRQPRSIYYVAEYEGRLLGGGGIYPTEGLPADTAELVKMYLLKEARGLGLGKLLIQKSLDFAKDTGYKNVYLETMPELKDALKTYAKFGFEYLSAPMGQSGHFGCELWMMKKL